MKNEVLDYFEDKKTNQKKVFLLLVFLLIYLRAYIESYSLQNEFMIRCTFAGCFLKFKYRIILEALSFFTYFLLGKQYLSFNLKKSFVTSLLFVLVFMLTYFYWIAGNLVSWLIPKFIFDFFDFNAVLYWSIKPFLGITISVFIMTFLLKRLRVNDK
jgi:hypothetical protein